MDSSRAVIPGADVTLRNEKTGVAMVRQTNETGRYTFDFVEPGTYTLEAQTTGFSRYIKQGIVVQVRGDVTVDATLTPGTVSESINVAAGVDAVQFNTATMDLTVDRKMLEDLPILGRNPFTLAQLNPAVQNLYNNPTPPPYYMWAASSINVGGQTYRSNELLIDGVSVQVAIKGSYNPPMDAVQEFTVEQNSVDAEFGHTAGGVLSLSMKSGTNEYHGTASYYGRNPALNAVTNPIARSPNEVRNHIWGGTFGGPIKKNKIFNFFSYEGWNQRVPASMVDTLPTTGEKTGDFSKALNAAGGQLTIYDPWSTTVDASGNATRTPFANNVVPSNRIDPTGQHIMNDLWAPNNPGDDIMGTNNFKLTYANMIRYWNISDRADWYITDKVRSYVRYSYFNTLTTQSNIANSPAVPNGYGGIMNALNIAGDTVYTINPTTVLELRLGYAGFADDYANPQGNIGDKGLAQIWPNNPWYEPYTKNLAEILYPAIYLNGTGNQSTSLGNEYQWYQRPQHFTYSGKLVKDRGIHSMKFGVEGRWDSAYMNSPNPMAFTFNTSYTASTFVQPDTRYSGSQFASLLLGATGQDQGSYASWNPALDTREHFWGAFFQDDIKLTRNLTVNLGLRWEYETGPRDLGYQYSRYLDLNAPIPDMQNNPPVLPSEATAIRTNTPAWNGTWLFTDPSHPYQFNTPKHEFMPRFGLAYRMNEKTALRFGYARYVVPPIMVAGTLGWINTPGFGATTYAAPTLAGIPGQQFSNPFPSSNPLIMPTGKADGIYTALGTPGIGFNAPNLVPQVNDRINASFQRELPAHFSFDGSFYLSMGRDKPISINQNMMDPQYLYTYGTQLNNPVANPFYDYLTPATFPGSMRYQSTVPLSQLLRPYPQFGNLYENNVGGPGEFYRALQLRVQRSFTNGASLLFTYYYAKDRVQQFFNDPDTFAQRYTWQTTTDPRHRVSAAGTYELPFGKGRKLLPNANRVLDGIVGGWAFSSILTFHSGDFLRFPQATVTADPGTGTGNWTHWFNTSVFAPPAAYTPRENAYQYEGLTGPRFWNIDSTLAKTFPINERFRLKFRLEAYNLTNSFIPNDPITNIYSASFGVAGTGPMFGNVGRSLQYSLQLAF